MILEKIIGNSRDMDLDHKIIDVVEVEWYETSKKILKKHTTNGLTVGIKLNEGHMHQGDVLYVDETLALVVEIKPCELISVSVDTMERIGKLCYEIGNRHLPLKISDKEVRVPYDHPTFEYIKKLGFEPEVVVDRFTGVTVCHGHAH